MKFTNILDTEMFGDDRKQYYFDIKKTKNERIYLQITNRQQEGNDDLQTDARHPV